MYIYIFHLCCDEELKFLFLTLKKETICFSETLISAYGVKTLMNNMAIFSVVRTPSKVRSLFQKYIKIC